jgi:hypothetical protein
MRKLRVENLELGAIVVSKVILNIVEELCLFLHVFVVVVEGFEVCKSLA